MKKTPFIKAVLTIIRKDLRVELRSRELLSLMGMFTLLSVMIFSFALQLDILARESTVNGVLWVTIVFASILGLNRSLSMEREQGNLDSMLLAPIDRTAIFFGKLTGNYLFAVTIGVLLLPLTTLLFNITLTSAGMLMMVLLGTLGISTIGTLLATMTVQTRTSDALLPIVMLPAVLPIVLSVVNASAGIINGDAFSEWAGWLQLVAMIDVIYLTLCFLLYGFVIEE